MKFLFDLFPLIAFFVAFKLGGIYETATHDFVQQYLSGIVSGGVIQAEQAPWIVATLAGILATAGMAAMAGRVVFQHAFKGRKRLLDAAADALEAGVGCGMDGDAHASSLICLARNRVCATIKAKKMPVAPNALKLTQAAISPL